MEILSFAIPFAALVLLVIIAGALMNHYMNQRGFVFNPHFTYLLLPFIVSVIYLVGGFSMWTVKGMILACILLYASVQDLSEREADDFLWVMLVILSLVNFNAISITSMVLGALGIFIPQMAVAMFTKRGGIGGADIKLSTAAALSLGYGGVIGYTVGLVFAIVFQLAYNHIKKQSNQKAFPLLPFLSTGLMIGYFI